MNTKNLHMTAISLLSPVRPFE